tara:strand:- start:73 stop:339 length:267 start_codon:yes stop_codon:yes gene_type:complete
MEWIINGLVFGLIDNGVLIIGAYTGCEIDRLFDGKGRLGAIIGAGVGNTISDALGVALDPTITGLAGIVLGCLLALILIPIFETIKNR